MASALVNYSYLTDNESEDEGDTPPVTHRGLQRRIAIKSHLVASLTIISNYINTINIVRLLSVELDSE